MTDLEKPFLLADRIGRIYARILPYLPTGNLEHANRALIEDLRSSIAELPPLETEGDIETVWTKFRREIRWLIRFGDVERFLRWKPIRVAMFADGDARVYSEYRELKSREDWISFWHPLTQEHRSGCPVPFWYDGRTSGNIIHQAYHLSRFCDSTGRVPWEYKTIVEFGGGYGCLARLIKSAGHVGPYYIFDLPEFSALQAYYLKSVGIRCCNLNAQNEARGDMGSDFVASMSDPQLLADLVLKDSEEMLFIAMWSLSEAPLAVRQKLESLVKRATATLFGIRDQFEGVDNQVYFESLLTAKKATKLAIPCTDHDFYIISADT